DHLEELLPIRKQGGLFPLASVSTALILGRLIGIERISHFEDIENETLLKCFFCWDKLHFNKVSFSISSNCEILSIPITRLRMSAVETQTLLKCFFGWDKLPDYTTYYNDLQRFEKVEDVEALKETNERLTERVLSKQNRVILDFDSSV